MDLLMDAMHKGGPFMWPLGFFALLGLAVPVVLGILAMGGKRIPAVLWLVVPGIVIVLGMLGTVQGLSQAHAAVVHASVETRSAMTHAGMSVALFTQFIGAFTAAILLAIGGWGACLAALHSGTEARFSAALAAALSGLLVLGGLLCLWLPLSAHVGGPSLWIGFMLIPFGLCLPVATLHSGGDADNRARLAEVRLGAALCVIGSVAAAGIGITTRGQIMVEEAFAHSSADVLGVITYHGLKLAQTGDELLLIGLAVAILASILALVPVARDLLNLRVACSIGGLLFGLLWWGGLSAKASMMLDDMERSTSEAQVAGLSAVVDDLPVGLSGRLMGFSEIWVLQNDEVRPYVDGALGEVISTPVSSGEAVLLATSGASSAAGVASRGWSDGPMEINLLLGPEDTVDRGYQDQRMMSLQYGTTALQWQPGAQALDPTKKFVVLEEEGERVKVEFLGSGEGARLVSKRGLDGELGLGAPASAALLLPHNDWTVQDLVMLCGVVTERKMDCFIQDPETAPARSTAEAEGLTAGGGSVRAGGDPIIMGALDKSKVDATMAANMTLFRACYERTLRVSPEVSGKYTLKVVIAKTGDVSKAATKKSTLNDAALEACILRQAAKLRFSEPKGGGIVILSYPLNFTAMPR